MDSKNITDYDLFKWSEEQRHLYAAGWLEAWKIKQLEAIPGWTWTPRTPKPSLRTMRSWRTRDIIEAAKEAVKRKR